MDNTAHTPEPTSPPAHVGVRAHVVVYAVLLALTGLTVAAASLDLGGFSVIVCLLIAGVQATLVLLYFMQLRHETHRVIQLVIPITVALLVVFIGITFVDVYTR